MGGFLLQWPTLLTLLMFPILVVAYTRLAITEERDVRAEFGPRYEEYGARTPRFIPRLRGQATHGGASTRLLDPTTEGTTRERHAPLPAVQDIRGSCPPA
jgi:hypothetical protein